MSHGRVTKAVHERIQVGRGAATGARGFDGRSGAGVGSESKGMAAGGGGGRDVGSESNVLQRWRREFRQGPGNAFPGNGKERWSEGRIAELERKIGQQSLEIDFLKGGLPGIQEQRVVAAST